MEIKNMEKVLTKMVGNKLNFLRKEERYLSKENIKVQYCNIRESYLLIIKTGTEIFTGTEIRTLEELGFKFNYMSNNEATLTLNKSILDIYQELEFWK